jgi:hypothetical protein
LRYPRLQGRVPALGRAFAPWPKIARGCLAKTLGPANRVSSIPIKSEAQDTTAPISGLRRLALSSRIALGRSSCESRPDRQSRLLSYGSRSHFAPHGAMLRELDVVGIRRGPSTDQTWLRSHKFQMVAVGWRTGFPMAITPAVGAVSEGARQVLITSQFESNDLYVGVQDTGPGLSPETLSRLFEPFHTTKPNGMGMGLTICRSIVEAHGGRLWVSACQPHGAHFQFAIPARPS